ncbi:3-oxoacyl-[acyl-carrier-protein] synthase III C-terminal domain-containing protein [Bacillus sp. FJAT-49736]|uniref:type III polyketide synthase n=1 Tax=Bacillus sp. FJAT-49736 TaxID=2833582 RepID=UPI001BC9B675|nr:3-oxoacyl-[acyl-carrier-protein] synthase III C-terminal domain-containing protein [Bacillus sp. FJAT-49736]MBS4173221.1 type III polyketide synthase [Bacillus sp. FJAT-49736]
MPKIFSIGLGIPDNKIYQTEIMNFAKQLFSDAFRDIERLLPVFQNAEIESRYFTKQLEWYGEDHSFAEKNEIFIENAERLCIKAIEHCLNQKGVEYSEIDAIYTICTSGLSTPSLEARIINRLPFRLNVKRIPIWGLGCVGGASGLSRAYEYCLAFPKAKVLVLSVELCSLTFQKNDHSKSNLIGTSLFGDGAACALLIGDEVSANLDGIQSHPTIVDTQSVIMRDSLDVMGWDVKNDGLHVIFSKDIPMIVRKWLQPNVLSFLRDHRMNMDDIQHFAAHPGGKKVMDAYVQALGLSEEKLTDSRNILKNFGNMSSVTILFVLKRMLEKEINSGEWGIALALGPGFSMEQLLLRWD